MNINLNINKDGLQELQKQFNNLTEISKKYASKGYKKSEIINYRSPKDEIEESFVRKANIKHFAFIFFVALIFLICFLVSIITSVKIYIIILLGLTTVICSYFAIKSLTTKELMIGKAIYKERKRNTSGKTRSYMYYVTIVDEKNKLIHSRIQISKNDYELIEEGTPILVSKGSGQGYIYE